MQYHGTGIMFLLSLVGYIVLAFKVLSSETNLERSWLDWSGAREIYK